jgi:hypothetical protein
MWAEKGEEKEEGLHACLPQLIPPASVVVGRLTALSKYPVPPKYLWVSGFVESYDIAVHSPRILRCSAGVLVNPPSSARFEFLSFLAWLI